VNIAGALKTVWRVTFSLSGWVVVPGRRVARSETRTLGSESFWRLRAWPVNIAGGLRTVWG